MDRDELAVEILHTLQNVQDNVGVLDRIELVSALADVMAFVVAHCHDLYQSNPREVRQIINETTTYLKDITKNLKDSLTSNQHTLH